MSRKQAAFAGLLGIIGGALAGSPFLDDTGACVAEGGTGFQCAMNEAIGPFISAVAIGFCLAILIGHTIAVMSRRALGPDPASRPSTRAAAEVDDPYLQIASWGLPPGGREPVKEAQPQQPRQPQLVEIPVEQAPAQPAPARPAPEPILEHDPRIRPPSRIGGIGSRGRPLPTPRRLV